MTQIGCHAGPRLRRGRHCAAPSAATRGKDVLGIVWSDHELRVLPGLRLPSVELDLPCASRAQSDCDIADHDDESNGKDGKEHDQVLHSVGHRRLFDGFADVRCLGDLGDGRLAGLLRLTVLTASVGARVS